MAEGKPAFKRALAVDIEKPSHQEASEVEDFPSPPPLYTPTTKELEETLDREMADKKPAFAKSLSLSIDRPTGKAAEESEPPPVDPLPTPSQKEIDNIFDEEMKHAEVPAQKTVEYCDDNGHEAALSKSQKKKAKKKAKKAEISEGDQIESIPVPKAYVPGSQWEPDDDDDDEDDLAARQSPAPAVVPAAKKKAATEMLAADVPPQDSEPRAYVPGSQWEPDEDADDSLEIVADKPAATPELVENKGGSPPCEPDAHAQLVPAAPATPASTDGTITQASKSKMIASPSPKRTELKPDTSFLKSDATTPAVSTPKPVPSKLSNDVMSKFAATEARPVALMRTPSGSTKKWAPVPAPVLRKSLIDAGNAAGEKHVGSPEVEPDVPEPAGPVEYNRLLAGDPGSWPKGIRADKREKYLSDAEFQDVFGMSKADFAKMKQWKKKELKKAVKLF